MIAGNSNVQTKQQTKEQTETYLSSADQERLETLSRLRRKTKSELVREAIRRYLDNHEQSKTSKVESELSMNIKNMTDRICGMLARHGVQTGVLFELAWQNHIENDGRDRFLAATTSVRSRLRKRLEDDEKAMAERMRGVVKQYSFSCAFARRRSVMAWIKKINVKSIFILGVLAFVNKRL